MTISAQFVISAARAADFPHDGAPEVALVGRSNVGKSSLINALVGRPLARTSAAPGKTRLANVYRVRPEDGRAFYLVDLPGYGFARGGAEGRRSFDDIVGAYFGSRWGKEAPGSSIVRVLLLVDARHPGLPTDRQAHAWLDARGWPVAIIATKTDKLRRAGRQRALGELETTFEAPVLPVSAATGEGLKELWKLIDQTLNDNSLPAGRPPSRSSSRPSRT